MHIEKTKAVTRKAKYKDMTHFFPSEEVYSFQTVDASALYHSDKNY